MDANKENTFGHIILSVLVLKHYECPSTSDWLKAINHNSLSQTVQTDHLLCYLVSEELHLYPLETVTSKIIFIQNPKTD